MKLKNVRLSVDKKTFLPMYTGEFAFNIELAQDMSSLLKDEDEIHRVTGKLFCEEVKRIKDENLLNVVEYEKSLFQQIRELEWVLMVEPKNPLGFTKHIQEYLKELLDTIESILDKNVYENKSISTAYEIEVSDRAASIADLKKYGLGLRTII